MQRKVDSFQRRVIGTFALNIRWPTIEKNKEIFTKTKLELWSIIIGKRHLKWFGKIAGMDPSTSAHSALHYALEDNIICYLRLFKHFLNKYSVEYI